MGFLGALSLSASGPQSRKPSRPEAERACDTELTARAPHPPSRQINLTRWRQQRRFTVKPIALGFLIVKWRSRAFSRPDFSSWSSVARIALATLLPCGLARCCSRGIHQIAKGIRSRREHQSVALADDFLVRFHGFDELIEASRLRRRLICRCVDAGRLGVRRAADLFDRLVGAGLDDAQIALLVAEDLRCLAFTLGAKARSDLLPLGDHALVNLLDHARVVVDALETHVQKLDAELAQLGGRCVLYLALDLFAPLCDGR